MTRDEEIREAAGQVAIRDNKGQYAHGFLMQALREAFTEGAEWADGHPRWISVEDELPKKDGKYLFYDEILGVQASIYYDGCTLTNSITHWMRIEPPAVLSSLESTEKKWRMMTRASSE